MHHFSWKRSHNFTFIEKLIECVVFKLHLLLNWCMFCLQLEIWRGRSAEGGGGGGGSDGETNLVEEHFSNDSWNVSVPCWRTAATKASSFSVSGRGDLDYVNLDRSKIPTPPYFIHEPNEPIIYFTLESTQASNGQNLDYLKERTLRCKAEGNPAPVCVMFFVYLYSSHCPPKKIKLFITKIHRWLH